MTSKQSEYIETENGNKVSRKAIVVGSQHIVLGGKTIIQSDCVIRGDLKRAVGTTSSSSGSAGVVVAIGRYCILSKGTVIRPPCRTYKGIFSYYPSRFGDHVYIGNGSIVKSASVGNHVYIGKNCIIGQFAILKDCCKIADNSVIAPNTVVPSFSHYSGNPARLIQQLPECTQEIYEQFTKEYYQNFQPI